MNSCPECTNHRTLVKICGLRRPQDAEAANRVLPDFAGFILSTGFRRSISPEQALTLRNILDPQIRTVGVFVDEPLESLIRIARSGCIDMVQLHGHESDTAIAEIAAMTGLPVIRSFRISGRADLIAAASSSADWVLLDSGAGTGQSFDWKLLEEFLREENSGGKMPYLREEGSCAHMQFLREKGSSEHMQFLREKGSCQHMQLLREKGSSEQKAHLTGSAKPHLFPGGHPWFLAGGLSAENAGEAVRRFCPTAVDVSSNVETDGWKDPAKMEAFVKAVRSPF